MIDITSILQVQPPFTFDATSTALIGQWSNVMLLESGQERIELFGSEIITLGSQHANYEVNLD